MKTFCVIALIAASFVCISESLPQHYQGGSYGFAGLLNQQNAIPNRIDYQRPVQLPARNNFQTQNLQSSLYGNQAFDSNACPPGFGVDAFGVCSRFA